jgi:hypothetical protein
LPYGNLSYIFEGRNPMAIQLRGRQKIAEANLGFFLAIKGLYKQRHRDRRPGTTAYPVPRLLGDGDYSS